MCFQQLFCKSSIACRWALAILVDVACYSVISKPSFYCCSTSSCAFIASVFVSQTLSETNEPVTGDFEFLHDSISSRRCPRQAPKFSSPIPHWLAKVRPAVRFNSQQTDLICTNQQSLYYHMTSSYVFYTLASIVIKFS